MGSLVAAAAAARPVKNEPGWTESARMPSSPDC
jgi:hypothetical protein